MTTLVDAEALRVGTLFQSGRCRNKDRLSCVPFTFPLQERASRPGVAAAAYAALGDKDEAFRLLLSALERTTPPDDFPADGFIH